MFLLPTQNHMKTKLSLLLSLGTVSSETMLFLNCTTRSHRKRNGFDTTLYVEPYTKNIVISLAA